MYVQSSASKSLPLSSAITRIEEAKRATERILFPLLFSYFPPTSSPSLKGIRVSLRSPQSEKRLTNLLALSHSDLPTLDSAEQEEPPSPPSLSPRRHSLSDLNLPSPRNTDDIGFDQKVKALPTSLTSQLLYRYYTVSKRQGDKQASQAFIALLYLLTDCSEPIPKKSECSFSTVEASIHTSFSLLEFSDKKCIQSILEMLFYTPEITSGSLFPFLFPYYNSLLNTKQGAKTLGELFILLIQQTSLSSCTNKKEMIWKVLYVLETREERSGWLTALSKSNRDKELSPFIHLCQKALSCFSFNEALPLFHEIRSHIPHASSADYMRIFAFPFPVVKKLGKAEAYKLPFNTAHQVVAYKDLFIGIYRPPSLHNAPHDYYLMAYDSTSQEWVWGIALDKEILQIFHSLHGIVLLIEADSQAMIVDFQTGHQVSQLQLPVRLEKEDSYSIFLNNQGCFFAFTQGNCQKLSWGEWRSSAFLPSLGEQCSSSSALQWKWHYRVPLESERFSLSESYLCFQLNNCDSSFIVDFVGKIRRFNGIAVAIEEDHKLFFIEISKENTCSGWLTQEADAQEPNHLNIGKERSGVNLSAASEEECLHSFMSLPATATRKIVRLAWENNAEEVAYYQKGDNGFHLLQMCSLSSKFFFLLNPPSQLLSATLSTPSSSSKRHTLPRLSCSLPLHASVYFDPKNNSLWHQGKRSNGIYQDALQASNMIGFLESHEETTLLGLNSRRAFFYREIDLLHSTPCLVPLSPSLRSYSNPV